MTFHQRIASALIVVGAVLLASCSSTSKSTPATPTPKELFINYTAIGASDAVGYGASVPCTTATPAEGPADPTCPEVGASGYVPDIRTDFAKYGLIASLQDLGYSGAVIGPDIQTLANTYDSAAGPNACQPRPPADQYPENFLQYELPKVNPNATFITIFAGGNDINGIVNALACGAGGMTTATQTAFITTWVTNFGHDFATLVGGVHEEAPGAIIIVANDPNFALVPYAAALPAPLQGALAAISIAFDQDVINTVPADGVPVVDLLCNPQSYNPANFYTDGFHPNDTGYALLAAQFVGQALATAPALPQSSCTYAPAAAAAKLRQAVPVGKPLSAYLRHNI
jgi:lysophospholipase L1-like esterase